MHGFIHSVSCYTLPGLVVFCLRFQPLEDKDSTCNLSLAERSVCKLGCLQRPEEGQSSPAALGAVGTLGNCREPAIPSIQDVPVPYLKGHRLPCSDVAKEEGGSGLQKSDVFPQRKPNTGLFLIGKFSICRIF